MGGVFGHISPMCGYVEWAEPPPPPSLNRLGPDRLGVMYSNKATKDRRISHAPVSHAIGHVSFSTVCDGYITTSFLFLCDHVFMVVEFWGQF